MNNKTKEIGIRLSVKDKEVVERALREVGQEGSSAFKKIVNGAQPASVSIRALNAAIGVTNAHLARLSGTAAFSGLLRSAAAALVPALGLTAAIRGAREALEEFGKIADDANASGVTTDFLQEAAYAAQQAGVSYDEFSSALITFNKNAGLAEAGNGRMVAQLKALNPELLRSIMLATSQEERVRLAADAINDAAGASEKAALATVLFGDAGARMVEVFNGGASALADMAAKARELGIVVDSELIQRAEQLGDEFDTASKVIDLQFKQVLIELAPIIVGTAQAVGAIAKAVRDLWKALGESPGWQGLQASTAPLNERALSVLQQQLINKQDALSRSIADPENSGWFGTSMGVEDDQRRLSSEIALIEAAIAARRDPTQFDVNGVFDMLAGQGQPQIFPTATGGANAGAGGDRNAEAERAIREAEQLVRRVQTASEEYTATLAKLDDMRAAGLISQESYNRGVAEASLELAGAAKVATDYAAAQKALDDALKEGVITEAEYTEAVEEMTQRRLAASKDWFSGIERGLRSIASQGGDISKDLENSLVSAASNFEDALVEAFESGKFSWEDLRSAIMSDLLRMGVRQGISGLAGLLGNIFSGGGGGGLQLGYQAGVGHGGATIGASATSRMVPATMFSNAARHHTGTDFLKPGEVPFIGMRGEEIGWPDQLRRKYGAQSTNVTVEHRTEIHNYGNEEVQTEQTRGADGVDVTKVIIGAVNAGIAEGRFDGTMGAVFGVKRKGH